MSDFSAYGGASPAWRAIEAKLPPPDPSLTPVERRDISNAWREATAARVMQEAGLAAQIHMADHAIPARDGQVVEGRTYIPRDLLPGDQSEQGLLPVYVHLHGGGWLYGTLASEDSICAALALRTRTAVFNVNYRHAPEHVYPTAWHDVQDALLWLHAQAAALRLDPARIVIGGISAGAQLAASVVLEQHLGRGPLATGAASHVPPLAGQVLMVPMLVAPDCFALQHARLARPAASSYVENAQAATLSAAHISFFMDLLQLPSPPDPADLQLSPGNATPAQVRGLPPTVFGISGLDPLRDEGLLYAKQLAEQGVPTKIGLFKGVPHGFRRYAEGTATARAWDEVLEQGIVWALSKPAATAEFAVKVYADDE